MTDAVEAIFAAGPGEEAFYDPVFCQATGVLTVRLDVAPAVAADLIRTAAGTVGIDVHSLALLIAGSTTPPP
jgi:hypothetical protein